MACPFDILSREQKVHRHYLIEASAGTGKTFSIQNLVVRLLLEGDAPPSLDQLLIVTFTRAATRELQQRIRQSLAEACAWLEAGAEGRPDYLEALMVHRERSIKRLEAALFAFDEAQIFTIHSFCFRHLADRAWESGFGIGAEAGILERVEIIKDFLRTELSRELLSAAQLDQALKDYRGDFERFTLALLRLCAHTKPIRDVQSYAELLEAFSLLATRLKGAPLQAFFQEVAQDFKGICDRQKRIKPGCLERVQRIEAGLERGDAEAFDELIREGLYVDAALHPSQLKAKAKVEYPDWWSVLVEGLAPLILRARSPTHIMACLAKRGQSFLRDQLEERGCLGPDELLGQMAQACVDPDFADPLRSKYRAVIIDEFQDTDPVQWGIFQGLFLEGWQGHLYLVGDPKQSIYRFRSADIYTYLKAGTALGEGAQATLGTNYRSSPGLIQALNAFFSRCRGFISLPRIQDEIPYLPVKAGKTEDWDLGDGRAPLHFQFLRGKRSPQGKTWPSQELQSRLFEGIASEISALLDRGVELSSQAILVRDRFQAEGMLATLKAYGIPAVTRRSESLAESRALLDIEEFLEAILEPWDLSRVKLLLGGRLVGWSADQLQQLDRAEGAVKFLRQVYSLHYRWQEDGLAAAWGDFLESVWLPDGWTVLERLLSQVEGEALFGDCQQIIEILVSYASESRVSPDRLVRHLYEWKSPFWTENPLLQRRQDPTQDAVQVMTLHVSKGLEFEVVFALGVCNRTPVKDILVPKADYLVPADPQESEQRAHLQELDAEKARQLYVALTRAKYRLYVPVLIDESGKPPVLGGASPMELFLGKWERSVEDYEEWYERIAQEDGKALWAFIQEQEGMSASELAEEAPTRVYSNVPSQDLEPPRTVEILSTEVPVQSFSRLRTRGHSGVREVEAPHDYGAAVKTTHTLPAGSEMGVLIHRFFEELPQEAYLQRWDESRILEFIGPYVAHRQVESWAGVLANLVYRTQTLDLGGFSLYDVRPDRMRHEADFLYHYAKPEQYFRGVIDLFFEHEGKYYLLDWKSNWLGPGPEDYREERMRAEMEHHEYFLQASLYLEALKRYLSWVEPRPFESCFGGIYYVFVRQPAFVFWNPVKEEAPCLL